MCCVGLVDTKSYNFYHWLDPHWDQWFIASIWPMLIPMIFSICLIDTCGYKLGWIFPISFRSSLFSSSWCNFVRPPFIQSSFLQSFPPIFNPTLNIFLQLHKIICTDWFWLCWFRLTPLFLFRSPPLYFLHSPPPLLLSSPLRVGGVFHLCDGGSSTWSVVVFLRDNSSCRGSHSRQLGR